MLKFSNFIVSHKKLIIAFYLIATLVSFIGIKYVNIEYDLSSYLPGQMSSVMGKRILQKDFGINGTASLMLKGREFYEVVNIKESIEEIPGVKSVMWLDDVEDIRKPREFMNESLISGFVRGEYSLLQIKFAEDNDSPVTQKAIDKIEVIADGEYYIGGQAAVSRDMRDTLSREIVYYSLAAFIIISIIMFMSSSSYFEPVLFFITIGVAIIINMGTNALLGKVSSNTYSVASIIQLAVSMDYSIFLLHRYHEESQNMERKKAMAHAISKSFSSVSASALTTVFGFLALLAMKYGIGKDMGLVLAKGVFLSLISVVTLLPCLTLVTEKRFGKYSHRIFLPDFKRSAKWFIRFRHVVLILFIIIVIPVFLGQSKLKYYYSNEATLAKGTRSVAANNRIKEVFGNNNQLVAIFPKHDTVKIRSAIEKIKSVEYVDGVEGLYSAVDYTVPVFFIPSEIREIFESEDYTYITIELQAPVEGEDTRKSIDSIKHILEEYFEKTYVTGEASIYKDLRDVTSKDFNWVTIISILLIGLVLLVTFKSIVLPVILVLVIQTGIWINMSIPYFQGTSLNFISFIIIGAIQLGATVDYAILFTSRYKENLEEMPPLQAMEKTIGDTGRSILTSVLILVAGTFSVSYITTIKSASELTLLIGRGAIISMILVFVLLPAILLLLDRVIGKTTKGWPRREKKNTGGVSL